MLQKYGIFANEIKYGTNNMHKRTVYISIFFLFAKSAVKFDRFYVHEQYSNNILDTEIAMNYCSNTRKFTQHSWVWHNFFYCHSLQIISVLVLGIVIFQNESIPYVRTSDEISRVQIRKA